MIFVETAVFTDDVVHLLAPDAYRGLQTALLLRPEQGALIEHGGGVRKLRWGLADRGKRGGVRVIYFWDNAADRIYLLLIYAKSERDDLTSRQLKLLRALVKKELRNE